MQKADTITAMKIANPKTGIVIQARNGSSRLPNKVSIPFYESQSILELLLQRVSSAFPSIPAIVATTKLPGDNSIVQQAQDNNCNLFRGSDTDVLDRFIGAAEQFKLSHVIRICSDNPFISTTHIGSLINTLNSNPDADYVGFRIRSRPAIKCHVGLFAELVSVKAMKLSATDNTTPNQRSHVTQAIYESPDPYKIIWLAAPNDIQESPFLRLTVDTDSDFMLCQGIYQKAAAIDPSISLSTILKLINTEPTMRKKMVSNIKENPK